MAKIKNMADLKKALEGKLSLALKLTQQEVYKTIQENIKKYYQEKVFWDYDVGQPSAIPSVYERTYQFLNSLIKSDIQIKNGKVLCSVKIDTDSLDYIQPGSIVVDMINRGYHADTSVQYGKYNPPKDIAAQSHFWDDSLAQLGGYNGILALMKNNCRKVGLPIQ